MKEKFFKLFKTAKPIIADGVIIGSSLKVNGDTWNSVDPLRAVDFMTKVNKIR